MLNVHQTAALPRKLYRPSEFIAKVRDRYLELMNVAINSGDKSVRSAAWKQACEEIKMAALDGRPVQTKEAFRETLASQKAASKADRNASAKQKFTASDESIKEVVFGRIREIGKQEGLDETKVESFIDEKSTYNVGVFKDGRVLAWFKDSIFKLKAPKVEPKPEDAYAYLCGNSSLSKWIEGGDRKFINEAMGSGNAMAEFFLTHQADKEAFDGVRAIGHRLGCCLYLHHIAGMQGDTVSVMHPTYDRHPDELATQGHADIVARVLSAATGREIKGVPSPLGFVKIRDRKCQP